jgi:hypothetical protein
VPNIGLFASLKKHSTLKGSTNTKGQRFMRDSRHSALGVLAALGAAFLLAAVVAHTQAQGRARSLLQRLVVAVPAQRELENFEVALDGKIIAREPNGDAIQMDEPGWQVCGRTRALRLALPVPLLDPGCSVLTNVIVMNPQTVPPPCRAGCETWKRAGRSARWRISRWRSMARSLRASQTGM